MKHNELFSKIALGIACTLGLGGAIGAGAGLFNQNSFEVKEAKAEGNKVIVSGKKANGNLVGNGDLMSPNDVTNDGKGGTVTYTEDSSGNVTLTFNNYNWTGAAVGISDNPTLGVCNMVAVETSNNVNIVINGTNTITQNGMATGIAGTNNLAIDIFCYSGTLTFSGTGSLTYSCSVAANNSNIGLSVGYADKTIIDGPSITINGGNAGNNYNNGGDAYGIECDDFYLNSGSLYVKSGTGITGTGSSPDQGHSRGIKVKDYATLYHNGGNLTAVAGVCGTGSSADSTAIYSYSRAIQIASSIDTFTATANKNGADNYIAIKGNVYPAVNGSAWSTKEGTGTPTTIQKNSTTQMSNNYKKVQFEGIKPYEITLNNGGATTAGTAKIYDYDGYFYLDADCTQKMTTTSNGITIPAKTGYTFDGYYYNNTKYIDANGLLTSSAQPFGEKKTLTASWVAHKTTISFNNRISDVPITDPVEATFGSNLPSVTPPGKNGYTFVGYGTTEYQEAGSVQYYNSNGAGLKAWDRDVEQYTLYAWWSARQYTITVDPNGGTVTPASWNYYTNNQELFPFAQGFAQNTPTRTGYTFVCWETNYQDTYMDGNILRLPGDTYGDFTITAKWEPKTYELTFNLEGGSGTAPTGLIATYDADMPTYGEAIPTKEGCTFDGFYDQENGEGTKYYNADLSSAHIWDKTTNATLYAFYTKDMTYEVIGYDGDYTRTAKSVIINMTDPDDTAYVKFSNDGGITYTVDYVNRPTFTDVGEYDVYYQISATVGGIKYTTVTAVEHISINRVDRTQFENLIDEATDFYNEIKDTYPNIANVLKTTAYGIDESNEFNEEDNLLPEEVEFGRVKLEEVFNQARAEVALVKINDIQPLACTDECKALIDDALNYYNGLSAAQKEIVGDAAYQELVHDLEVYTHVKNFYNLVEAIDAPTNTQTYKDQIDAARSAYNALTDSEEKPLVDASILATLVTNEDIYNYFSKVNDVAKATDYSDYVSKVGTARSTYDALSTEAKAMVPEKDFQLLLDEEKAKETIDSIHNIGTVEYTDASKTKIDAARTAYDALNDAQKAFANNVNYQELVDAEHVYEAFKVISNIGDVEYTYESHDKIIEAREYYDSLTEAQKQMVGKQFEAILINAEAKYDSFKNTGNILLIIFIILACLLIVGGFWFFFFLLAKKRKKDDDEDDNSNGSATNKKTGTVKAMSISVLPVILLSGSHYLDSPYIALYVLAGIAALIWIIDVVILVLVKKGIIKPFINLPFFKKNGEEVKAVLNKEDEDEVVTVTDAKGNKFQIRFVKSFTAKLIQSSDETKAYYKELKNEVLSYKKTNSRVSWSFDSINAGREYIIKFGMRGKTLCVYYPLNADDYVDSKYKVEKVEAKKYEAVPCLYRINNDRRLAYAKELIAVVASKLGLEKGETPNVNYYLPYEDREPLLARGLIKELKVSLNPVEAPTPVNEEEEVIRVVENGVAFEIRFNRSYTAKLIQSSDEAKGYYNELKNYILSYKGVSNRTSWHYESFNSGRTQLFKFNVKGKTLCVYYPLKVEDYKDSKYIVEEATSKKFEEVPCLYRIKNPRRCSYAKELIDEVMKANGIIRNKEQHEKYDLPYESREPLLARGLIKEVKTRAKEVVSTPHHNRISVFEADVRMSDEVAASHIKEDVYSKRHKGKKAIINIDTIGDNYSDGDKITLESLIEKKLVPSDTGYVKVLGRGYLSKKLHVDLQEYSLKAVKMIVLEGGTVEKAK